MNRWLPPAMSAFDRLTRCTATSIDAARRRRESTNCVPGSSGKRISSAFSMPKPSKWSRGVGFRQTTTGLSEMMNSRLWSNSSDQLRLRRRAPQFPRGPQHHLHRELVTERVRLVTDRDVNKGERGVNLGRLRTKAEVLRLQELGDEVSRNLPPIRPV